MDPPRPFKRTIPILCGMGINTSSVFRLLLDSTAGRDPVHKAMLKRPCICLLMRIRLWRNTVGFVQTAIEHIHHNFQIASFSHDRANPRRGSRGHLKNRKKPSVFAHHANPRRGSRGHLRNRKKSSVFESSQNSFCFQAWWDKQYTEEFRV